MCPECESTEIGYDRYAGGYVCPECGWEEIESDNPCLTDAERNK